MSMPVAICRNDKMFDHASNWNREMERYCQEKSIQYEIINCYDYKVISKLKNYSALLWPIQNFVLADSLEALNILRIAENMGLKVFPNQNTVWHFDDKIAEMYAFEKIGAPIPESYVFYRLDDCMKWLDSATFPIVAKVRRGAGSENVKLLKSKQQAASYAERMFGKGYSPAPKTMARAKTMLQSSKNFNTIIERMKKIPQFLNTRAHGLQLPYEKGYCYFQEFIPNEGYDLKIVVVENKLSFIGRRTRKKDFRASGSGALFYNRSFITDDIIHTAFDVYDKLQLQCIGFDFVIDNRDGKSRIVEMSYGFDWVALKNAGCYWDRNCVWHDEPLNVPAEVVQMIVGDIQQAENANAYR